jgi:glycoprotein-N-acetylgalactosamine 3-beta-galactosyltransferase
VPAGDSRDTLGRSRFLAFRPEQHLSFGSPSWYYKCVYYAEERVRIIFFPRQILQHKEICLMYYFFFSQGLNCCSNSAITFHYVRPDQMYVFDYLLYRLHPYGICH